MDHGLVKPPMALVELVVATTHSFVPQRLVQGGFRLTLLKEEEVNLETAFMRLTKGMVQ